MAGLVYPDLVLPDMQIRAGYGYMLPVPGAGSGTAPFTWTVKPGYTLPAGLNVAANGYISSGTGSSTPAGIHDLRLVLTDSTGLSDDDVKARLHVLNWQFAYRLISAGYGTLGSDSRDTTGHAGPYLVDGTFYVVAAEVANPRLTVIWSTDQYVTKSFVPGPLFAVVTDPLSGLSRRRGNYDSCLAGDFIWVLHTSQLGYIEVSAFHIPTKSWVGAWINDEYTYYYTSVVNPNETGKDDLKQIVPLSDGSFCLFFGNTDAPPDLPEDPAPRSYVTWMYFYPDREGDEVWGFTGSHGRPPDDFDGLPDNYGCTAAWAGADDTVYFVLYTAHDRNAEYAILNSLVRDPVELSATLTEWGDIGTMVGAGGYETAGALTGEGAVLSGTKMGLPIYAAGYQAAPHLQKEQLLWGDTFPLGSMYTQYGNTGPETGGTKIYARQAEPFGDGRGFLYWQSNRMRITAPDGSIGIELLPTPYDGAVPLDITNGLSAGAAGEHVASVWPRLGAGTTNLWFGIWTHGPDGSTPPDGECPIPNYAF